MTNRIRQRSLHPFQILFNGSDINIQRGLVIDLERAKVFDVEGITADLRYEQPEQSFPTDIDINIKLITGDVTGVSDTESVPIESAVIYLAPRGEEKTIFIGNVTDGVVTQNLKSDVYAYIAGQQIL